MTTVKRLYVLLALLSVLVGTANGQSANSWKHVTENDALHAKVLDRFILPGKYLIAPRIESESPALVVVCSAGKVQENYIFFGAVLVEDSQKMFPVNMEARIDGHADILPADAVSTDGTAAYFTRVDLAKILRSRTVVVGADEYLGPEITIQFEIPDSAEIWSSCSRDSILKRAKH